MKKYKIEKVDDKFTFKKVDDVNLYDNIVEIKKDDKLVYAAYKNDEVFILDSELKVLKTIKKDDLKIIDNEIYLKYNVSNISNINVKKQANIETKQPIVIVKIDESLPQSQPRQYYYNTQNGKSSEYFMKCESFCDVYHYGEVKDAKGYYTFVDENLITCKKSFLHPWLVKSYMYKNGLYFYKED